MSDSHILCSWTWNSSRSKLDSAGSSPDGMIRPNSLVIHIWILSRVPSYQYVPQSDQDTGLILDILLSSLISSVQNWFMQLMNEIQIPCNEHSIPDSQQSHIPWLSTISLGFNHPDLPSILQVLVSTFRALYMPFPLTRWDFSLLMPSFLPYRPQFKCHFFKHAFTDSAMQREDLFAIVYQNHLFHSLVAFITIYNYPCLLTCLTQKTMPIFITFQHLEQCLALSSCQINTFWVNLQPYQVIVFFLNQNALPSLYP